MNPISFRSFKKRTLRLSGRKECFMFDSWLELFRPCLARPLLLVPLQPKKSSQSSKEGQTNFQCLNCSQDMVCAQEAPPVVAPSASCYAFSAWQNLTNGVWAGGLPSHHSSFSVRNMHASHRADVSQVNTSDNCLAISPRKSSHRTLCLDSEALLVPEQKIHCAFDNPNRHLAFEALGFRLHENFRAFTSYWFPTCTILSFSVWY